MIQIVINLAQYHYSLVVLLNIASEIGCVPVIFTAASAEYINEMQVKVS